MAPIKFEDDIKDKLNKRTIIPSDGAWEKLAERLDADGSQKNKTSYWWIGMAASFLGILLVVTQFFSNTTDVNPQNIVSDPSAEHIINSNKNIDSIVTGGIHQTIIANDNETGDKIVQDALTTTKDLETEILGEKSNNYQVASGKIKPIIKEDKDVIKSQTDAILNFEAEKAQQVADVIYNLSSNETQVSNADIDSLLEQAQREILLSKMKGEDKVVIDAALLLQDVELELDESFREKVFKAFKSTYGSVKTAIAQRNE